MTVSLQGGAPFRAVRTDAAGKALFEDLGPAKTMVLVQPDARNPLPEFKRAIVVFGNKAVIANTLQDALKQVFGAAPETREEEPGAGAPPTTQPGQPGTPVTPGTPAAEVDRLLAEAQDEGFGGV